jgi:hypothetical protein
LEHHPVGIVATAGRGDSGYHVTTAGIITTVRVYGKSLCFLGKAYHKLID